MKRILVTGGAGFIGSNITDFLLEKNYRVRVLDNLSTGNKNNLSHHSENPNFEFMYGDITNLEHLRKACKDVDAICHQAALGSVPRSIEDPLSSHNANVNGYLNLLVAAKENNMKRVVYASSSSVYGDEPNLPKVEPRIGKQLSPYAVTKYIDELYGRLFSELYGMECIGFRYFNVFGPRQDPNGPYAAVIPKFIDCLKKGIAPTINGDGTYSRDFTYVENVVQANYLGLTVENPDCFGQIFNIGAGGRVTIGEMYEMIRESMGVDIKANHKENRKGDIPHSNANVDKAKELLGYIPKIDFKTGIQLLLRYNQCS
jgi:UDP-N-acetylglucosamine 4-epimerase